MEEFLLLYGVILNNLKFNIKFKTKLMLTCNKDDLFWDKPSKKNYNYIILNNL